MVIAKSEWFKRRKYGGWGLFPVTWQGWLYTIILVAIILGTNFIPFPDIKYLIGLYVIIGIFLVIDLGSAMVKIKDEREKIHEAIAERNALWAVILVLVVGVGYQASSSLVKDSFSSVDPFLIAALVVALIVKAVSNAWLDRRD